MSFFKKLKEKKQAEMVRKSEMMQGFTMQAELSATIVTVKMLGGDAEKTNFLVEYANGEKQLLQICRTFYVPRIKSKAVE